MAEFAPKKIVSFGEVLWDLLPGGKRIGGAPLNFALRCKELGNDVTLISSVGCDDLGDEAIKVIRNFGLSTDCIIRDPDHPTGTVTVEFANGQPKYEIHRDVAFDFIKLNSRAEEAVKSADCVYFGTLISRNNVSAQSLGNLLAITPSTSVHFVDVNLRQGCYTLDDIKWTLENADVFKFSDDEMDEIGQVLDAENCGNRVMDVLNAITGKFRPRCTVMTKGSYGAIAMEKVARSREVTVVDPLRVQVIDTVGAGDAFAAGLIHGYLNGMPLMLSLKIGNNMGALAVTKMGGTARFSPQEISEVLSCIQ